MEFSFDPDQDTKLEAGDPVYLLFGIEPEKHAIKTIDLDRGLLQIKFGPKRSIPDSCHIIPNEYLNSDTLQEAVQRFAESWSDVEKYRAVKDLLHRRAPRLTGATGGALLPDPAHFPDDLISLIQRLDRTTLCIQGPLAQARRTTPPP